MTPSFLGIPVDGDIVRADKKKDQLPLSDLAPLMQVVLDDDGIACFGWQQFTPYFNDGDPCVFGVSSLWAARPEDVRGDSDDFDRDELEVEYGSHLGSYEGREEWVPDPADPVNRRVLAKRRYVGPDQARYDNCLALATALGSGSFDDVLLEAFGDHAEVTVRRTGITIEFCQHD